MLDTKDRAVLSLFGVVALLVLAGLLVGAVALGLAVRVFLALSGV